MREILVVGQDQHDVRLARYGGGSVGRARALAQADDESDEHRWSKPGARRELMTSCAPLRATQLPPAALSEVPQATFWLATERP